MTRAPSPTSTFGFALALSLLAGCYGSYGVGPAYPRAYGPPPPYYGNAYYRPRREYAPPGGGRVVVVEDPMHDRAMRYEHERRTREYEHARGRW